ncbi:MAG: leucine-rich repeat protein, partial [Acutalibacteraceae bacterium]
DNNCIYNNKSKPLDGNGIRFWYKASGSATFQFIGGGTTLTYSQSAVPEGGWVTIYYKDVISDGDLSAYYQINLKNNSTSGYYVDELHTIWEKEGDVSYELNGDGTASVVGYNLRLEEVVIAETYKGCPVVSIKDNAMSGSLTLKSVSLPDSVISIGANAFDGCLNLKSINLENVTTIGDGAFNNCEKLTDLNLSDDTENISPTAFTGCNALYINVENSSNQKLYAVENSLDYKCVTDSGLQYYRDFDEDSSTVNIIGYIGTDENIVVPSQIDSTNVVKIASGCFSENTSIKSVDLADTVTTIESEAFSLCSSLTTVKMSGVVTLGSSAFYKCGSLETAAVGDNISTIGSKCFFDCTSLKEFYFADSLTSIAENAFYNTTPVAVMSDNTYTTKTGYSYEYVNNNNFKYYPGNSDVFDYYVVKYIATISGYKQNNQTVNIPSDIDGYEITGIGENAFKDNKVIASVIFNDNMRNIDDYAFYGCSNLSSVTFPNSLRNINDYAFASCESLAEVSITNVVVVAPTAFDDTTKINIIQTDFIRSALDYVDGMTAGWNLGNTLDAHSGNYGYGDLTVTESEQLWRHYNYISQDLFNMVVEKFNTIRIPITWNAFINPNDNYNIDKDFMDRIQEVVDMCYKAGFKYIIINTHHDSDYYFNVHPDNDHEVSKVVIRRVWEQICERFADYDEKLIFESMNEIHSQGADVGGNGDWYGHSDDLFVRLNNLNKIFVETVRNSGGNNAQRYLMIQSYGGQKDNYQLSKMWLPSVEEDDHIIGSVHWYIETLTEAHYTPNLERLQNYFVNKGIPCVIGEIGLPAYYDQGVITVYNDDYREQWGSFVFGLFERYRLKAIIWEDHGTYSTVSCSGGNYSWKFPKYVESIYNATKKENIVENTVTIDGEVYKTVNAGSELILPDSSADNFVCYYDGSNSYNAGDKITVKSDITLTSLTLGNISMLSGASMRLTNISGMRFYTKVDSDKIQNLRDAGLTVSLGTIIAPKDLLSDGELTFEKATVYQPGMVTGEYQCVDVKYESSSYFQDGNTFVGTIANVRNDNAARDFVGRGYVKVTVNGTEKTFYAGYYDNDINNNSRSIGYLATSVKNDTDTYSALSDENKAIVNKYVSLYVDSIS